MNSSKSCASAFPENDTIFLLCFTFLSFVLCLLHLLPSSCLKFYVDSGAVPTESLLGLVGSEWGRCGDRGARTTHH